jgi:hypothetical protein
MGQGGDLFYANESYWQYKCAYTFYTRGTINTYDTITRIIQKEYSIFHDAPHQDITSA